MALVLALNYGESPWPTETEPWCAPADLADCVPNPGNVDVASVCRTASAILRRASGRAYGVREVTVRPHRLVTELNVVDRYPVPTDWTSGGIGWGWWRGEGGDLQGLVLDAPAVVSAVVIDGVALTTDQWTLYDGRLLVRANGIAWPDSQDLTRPLTESGTWSITYQSGIAVPTDAVIACQALACQLLKLLAGSGDCQIPDRVTSLTRQGVQMTRLNPDQFIKDGLTGVYIADLWLASLLTSRKRRRASIASPESIREART